jgi:8-oxo-dGTP pyrophosphatase MutT (NUDIX family)
MDGAVVARPAATVILVRDGASGLEVFMVERHRQIEFASGALVFPGGGVDEADFAIAADPARGRPPAGLDQTSRALRVAAIRETFEECGVLLARPRGSAALVDGARGAAIAAAAPGRSFAELIAAEDLALALDVLTPFAHWITPAILPKRFDTHFFIAAAPADQLARHDGSESVDSVWINPTRALSEADAGRFTIVSPTRLNIQMLGAQNDVASALAAARARRIVTVEPVATPTATGFTMTIPIEAGYGGDTFVM